jgi:hypothetical protein
MGKVSWRIISVGFLLAAVLAGQAVDREALNSAFQIHLWQDDSLWDDPDADVARRLGWPRESQTTTESSFRLYPSADSRILGARPHSLVLYGKSGKVARVSMVFANKGDLVRYSRGTTSAIDDGKASGKAIAEDAKKVEAALADLFGRGDTVRFDAGTRIEETVTRWDWQGHAFMVAAQPDEYVALRILPVEAADNETRGQRSDREDPARLFAERVEKRANGDVIVKDIPMVNQGPKGYCVPATWERYLRYMGVPADMYLLAMAGRTWSSRGTDPQFLAQSLQSLVTRYERKIERIGFPITVRNVAEYTDQGLPLMWSMFVVDRMNADIARRSQARRQVRNWDEWTDRLGDARRAAKDLKLTVNADGSGSQGYAHSCMLIGYNAQTRELAMSDSWGPEYAERWLTEEEAQAINGGVLWIIKW